MLSLSRLPNHMQMITKVFAGWPFLQEVLNFIQLRCSACFKATWVMKDKCCITLEYHFILNIMLSSLPHFEQKVIATVDPQYLCSWIELGQVNLSTSTMLGDDV